MKKHYPRCIKKLKGKKFGRLTVIGDSGKRISGAMVLQCKCDCGKDHLVKSGHLKTKSIISCGCYKVQRLVNREHIVSDRKKQSNNTSGYTGVAFKYDIEKWQTYIERNGQRVHLGCHYDIIDAIKVRNDYIIKHNIEKEYKIQ